MKMILKKISKFFIENDVWIYAVVIIFIGIGFPKDVSKSNWSSYLYYLSKFTLLFVPQLLFVNYKKWLNNAFHKRIYYSFLVLSFVIYPALILTTNNYLIDIFSNDYENGVFFGISIIFCSFYIILETQKAFFKNSFSLLKWFINLGLDAIILIVLLLFALLIASFVVSNLEKFYNTRGTAPTIEITQIFLNLGTYIVISIQLLLTYLGGFFFYYVNRHFLIPKILKNRGVLVYILSVLGTVAFFYPIIAQLIMFFPIHQQLQILTPSEDLNPFNGINGLVALAIMAISLPVTIALQWFEQNTAIATLEKEKSETELNLLKQQINPHFFFNTLNNLYSLSLKKSQQTPEVILQLSELMRYVIYKGKENLVSIIEDVRYIEDYIRLQQIRLHKNLNLTINKNIDNENLKIPPMLFIILVENAFKHGIEPAEGACFLSIKIETTEEYLTFECENSYENSHNKQSGIGLINLKRRLSILFPAKHTLKIDQNDTSFKAILNLNIK